MGTGTVAVRSLADSASILDRDLACPAFNLYPRFPPATDSVVAVGALSRSAGTVWVGGRAAAPPGWPRRHVDLSLRPSGPESVLLLKEHG
jgi:hypothetical protein